MLQEKWSTGDVVWDEWILGFEYAVGLRRAAWARTDGCRESGMVKLVAFLKDRCGTVSGESRVDEEAFTVLGPVVPTLIWRIVGKVR